VLTSASGMDGTEAGGVAGALPSTHPGASFIASGNIK